MNESEKILAPYNSYFKRHIDIFISGVALIILMPILILVAVLIKFEDNGPIFYEQYRLGKLGRIIRIHKFRSMTNKPSRIPGESGELFCENAEITSIGKWIRRIKIDELPQLINVFKGEMSLVGPRPCLPELASEFNENGRKRLNVQPGCTGLAQVFGNIHLSWAERWKYDAYYVDNVSFNLDMKIVMKTLWLIVCGEERLTSPFDIFIANQQDSGSYD
jgi:lipopolysaccharide/colanic/teichoic acid biosynthesis glycosyltransferase